MVMVMTCDATHLPAARYIYSESLSPRFLTLPPPPFFLLAFFVPVPFSSSKPPHRLCPPCAPIMALLGPLLSLSLPPLSLSLSFPHSPAQPSLCVRTFFARELSALSLLPPCRQPPSRHQHTRLLHSFPTLEATRARGARSITTSAAPLSSCAKGARGALTAAAAAAARTRGSPHARTRAFACPYDAAGFAVPAGGSAAAGGVVRSLFLSPLPSLLFLRTDNNNKLRCRLFNQGAAGAACLPSSPSCCGPPPPPPHGEVCRSHSGFLCLTPTPPPPSGPPPPPPQRGAPRGPLCVLNVLFLNSSPPFLPPPAITPAPALCLSPPTERLQQAAKPRPTSLFLTAAAGSALLRAGGDAN